VNEDKEKSNRGEDDRDQNIHLSILKFRLYIMSCICGCYYCRNLNTSPQTSIMCKIK